MSGEGEYLKPNLERPTRLNSTQLNSTENVQNWKKNSSTS